MKNSIHQLLILFSSLFVLTGCGEKEPKRLVGIYSMVEDPNKGDTIYSKIPGFSFVDQTGKEVTQKDFENKIYVADFFFSTCQGICPKMTNQLTRVQEAFKDEKKVKIISHTVDPKNDSVKALAAYGSTYKVNPEKWHLVTGNRDSIYSLGIEHYKLPVAEDAKADGGFLHSEFLVLVDKNKHIRGYYDGTVSAEVDRLIKDIKLLIEEDESK